MKFDENTKVIARLHTQPNNRGLNIYNPYFQETGTNAVYLLFYNENPAPLLDGIKNLNIAGAISAGFEKSSEFASLLDDLTPISKKLGRVGIVVNDNGKLTGHYQGGTGLLKSITTKYDLINKKLVIMGSGTVTRGLLYTAIEQNIKFGEVNIYNRTIENTEKLIEEFGGLNIKAFKLDVLDKADGQIFVNTSSIGSPWRQGEDFIFTENFVRRFEFIADVAFVPLKPQLIEVAEKVGVPYSPGWRMFLYQGEECLKRILKVEVDTEVLTKHLLKDFEENWS